NFHQASEPHVLKHICPDFNVLTRRNAVVNDFLMSIRFNANGNIYCFTLKRFLAQRNVGSVQINAEELVTEFALMIGLNFWNHLLGDVRYLSWAVMAAIHLFNQVGYFSGDYAFGIQLDNRAFQDIRVLLVVRQRVLMKQAVAVSWH